MFGVRPEHIGLRTNGMAADGRSMKVKVDVVEMLGSESIFYLLTGNEDFVAKTDYQVSARAGDEVEAVVNMEKMHIFDAQTQEVVR